MKRNQTCFFSEASQDLESNPSFQLQNHICRYVPGIGLCNLDLRGVDTTLDDLELAQVTQCFSRPLGSKGPTAVLPFKKRKLVVFSKVLDSLPPRIHTLSCIFNVEKTMLFKDIRIKRANFGYLHAKMPTMHDLSQHFSMSQEVKLHPLLEACLSTCSSL